MVFIFSKQMLCWLWIHNFSVKFTKKLGRGVMVTTTAQLHSTKPELRFCARSNPARSVSEIRDGEHLWQWSGLEIRLNAFHRSTIPRKQFMVKWTAKCVFRRCSYKYDCFSELLYNSNVLVLTICSFKDILKNLLLSIFC